MYVYIAISMYSYSYLIYTSQLSINNNKQIIIFTHFLPVLMLFIDQLKRRMMQ